MLTMTVMQNDRGSVGQFGTEPTETEDVLSRLRHLHRTLQECHWRVQVVDHALCAQGENDKGHHGLQNQTGNYHSCEIQATKESSFQNQTAEDYCLQLETVKGCNSQNKAENDQNVEEHVRETIDAKEQLENDRPQDQSKENQNYHNEDGEKSENQFCEDDKHQKPAKEKHSLLHSNTIDQKLSMQAEDHNNQDLSHDTKKKVDYITDNNLSNISLSDHTLLDYGILDYGKKDNYIHIETKENNYIHNSFKEPLCDDKYSLETKQNKYFTRQECMDMGMEDLLPIDHKEFFSSTSLFQHDSTDLISPLSSSMTDLCDQQAQLTTPNKMFSKKLLRQRNWHKGHHVRKVRHRPHVMQELEYEICDKGDRIFCRKLKEEDLSKEQQEKKQQMEGTKYTGLPHVDSVPEVGQKMDLIWEALENLRSHFLSLHSSLVDSSNLFGSHEFAESSDKSYISSKESGKVTKLQTMLDDLTSEPMQLHQTPSDQALLGKLPVGHHCACQNQINSHTCLEKPVNSAALSDMSRTARPHLQNWRDNCLCILMIVMLLLLFLFLASCLLLMLPVVSVSVRTAGGLPAF